MFYVPMLSNSFHSFISFFPFFLMSSEESPYVEHYVEHEIKEEDGHGSMDDKGNLTLVAQLYSLRNSR